MKLLFENWRSYLIQEEKALETDQVSKVVLFNKDQQVLLLKSALGDFKGEWDLPGGHIHRDESHVEGLKREVSEETGLDIYNPVEVLKQGRITFYRASMPSADITLSHEHSEHKFFDVDEVLEKDFNTSDKFKKVIKKASENKNEKD